MEVLSRSQIESAAAVRTLVELTAETVLAVQRSFFWLIFSVLGTFMSEKMFLQVQSSLRAIKEDFHFRYQENLLSINNGTLGERSDVIDMILGRRKSETMPENKDDGESDEDDGDEDDEDGEEDDGDEDFSNEEGNEEGEEDDDEPGANGEGGSEEEDDEDDDDDDEDDDDDGDDDEDDDEEDEDEEMHQPPPKKKK